MRITRLLFQSKGGMTSYGQYTASLSAWFCIPEQGMDGFEIMSRASAFLVKADVDSMKGAFPVGHESTMGARYAAKAAKNAAGLEFRPTHHVVTSSHVVSPWLWPKYYPEEWLQFVNEQHTYYTLEVRDQDGTFISQVECNPVTYHHPNKDLAILHLADEAENLDLLRDTGYHVSELIPPSIRQDVSFLMPGKGLKFAGHNVTDTAEDGRSNFPPANGVSVDSRKPIPTTVHGQVVHKSEAQIFCKTETVLTYGMCGGPVVVSEEDGGGGLVNGQIAGMIEGIVPMEHPVPELQGLAVFIDSDDIRDFVREVEGGRVEPLLGGHSLDVVGSSPGDPDKYLHEYEREHDGGATAFKP
jgi:hypothetical protein